MPRLSEQLQEHALDLAWSLWAELGVSGWSRRHVTHAIDPEPLILFTSFLGDADPRLRDESTDWCITYGRYLSATRLRNFLAGETRETRAAFGEFAATVNASSPLRWPGATEPRPFERTGRSEIAEFAMPSLVTLRLRAMFGVGARAEIIRSFLAEPTLTFSAAELAVDAGYTKRNIAEALDALGMAGLLEVTPVRNQLRYGLPKRQELRALVGGFPTTFPKWRPIFRISQRVLDTAHTVEDSPPNVRLVEAARTMHDLEGELRLVGAKPAPLADEQGWLAFERWALRITESWARGDL